VLVGCALFAVSIFLPVMRWSANEAHSTAGSARVFLGSGYQLVDGGFPGTALLPVAILAIAVLAIVTVVGAGAATWWVQLGSAAVACYYPLWVVAVFAKKWEDDVDPAIGVVGLLAAYGCIGAGLWSGRPRRT
jgi:hypothetical protein